MFTTFIRRFIYLFADSLIFRLYINSLYKINSLYLFIALRLFFFVQESNFIQSFVTSYIFLCTGIKFGSEKEWNHCWKNYQETQVPSEKRIMLQALGATTDSWLLQRYLLRSLDRDMVRSQDVETVIASVATNPEGQFLAWRHLKAYWPQIHVLFGNGSLTMGSLISVVISDFFTEYDYHEVSKKYTVSFFKHNFIMKHFINNVPNNTCKRIIFNFIAVLLASESF